ncbi:hypothetical protein SCHPADRAFT_894016 [Schizopora paradoxa]|uniref:Uncharacterized protein n=1 Tax=Schizopora paradoxa TaxID=27342 RepID=A0A0H2R8R9_9AGAM|nr:hypothetical protein SCHPADRAFT_894016 [Schizopora paradoxa]
MLHDAIPTVKKIIRGNGRVVVAKNPDLKRGSDLKRWTHDTSRPLPWEGLTLSAFNSLDYAFPVRSCLYDTTTVNDELRISLVMKSNTRGEAGSYPRKRGSHDERRFDDETPDISLRTSFLDELHEDDTTTSRSSNLTLSTNYTMSNLPGPGRLLGNLYSKAGSSLERRLGRFANREAIKEYNEALVMVQSGWKIDHLLCSEDSKEHEKACRNLLICAESNVIDTQIKAFELIIEKFVFNPLKVRSTFRRVFKERREISDVITFSWKRPGVEYTTDWLYWYKLASRCLSPQSSPFLKAAIDLDTAGWSSLNFLCFEVLLLSCSDICNSDTTDLLLAIHFIACSWDSNGIEDYVQREGIAGAALVKFVTGLVAHWELKFSLKPWSFYSSAFFSITGALIDGLMRPLRVLGPAASNELLEDETRLAVCTAVFKLHHFLRSHNNGKSISDALISKTWKEVCFRSLPDPGQKNLRRKLLRLQDIHGAVMCKRFPPVEDSLIDREERARAELDIYLTTGHTLRRDVRRHGHGRIAGSSGAKAKRKGCNLDKQAVGILDGQQHVNSRVLRVIN